MKKRKKLEPVTWMILGSQDKQVIWLSGKYYPDSRKAKEQCEKLKKKERKVHFAVIPTYLMCKRSQAKKKA